MNKQTEGKKKNCSDVIHHAESNDNVGFNVY